jgi:hypothetical protein
MTPGQQAEARIAELGINDPQDLDIEAIAFDAGVHVEYENLIGCEATLVGFGSRAIATIKPSGARGRERFSIAHELGHWERHRGKSFQCRVDDQSNNLASNSILEREADDFASHILMPSTLFNPVIKSLKWPSLNQFEEVADLFKTSTLATTIRLAKIDTLPVVIASYTGAKRRWFTFSPHVPRRWWLKEMLDEDSFAHDLLNSGTPCKTPRKQSADAWFMNDDAEEFEVLEQCYSHSDGQVLVILYLTDAEMFERGFDPFVGRRR